jgi:hypothetical protein
MHLDDSRVPRFWMGTTSTSVAGSSISFSDKALESIVSNVFILLVTCFYQFLYCSETVQTDLNLK